MLRYIKKKVSLNEKEIQKKIEKNEKEINRIRMRLSVLKAMQKLVVKSKVDRVDEMEELDESLIVTCSNCEWEIDPLNYCVKKGKIICHRCTELIK